MGAAPAAEYNVFDGDKCVWIHPEWLYKDSGDFVSVIRKESSVCPPPNEAVMTAVLLWRCPSPPVVHADSHSSVLKVRNAPWDNLWTSWIHRTVLTVNPSFLTGFISSANKEKAAEKKLTAVCTHLPQVMVVHIMKTTFRETSRINKWNKTNGCFCLFRDTGLMLFISCK